MTADHHHSHKSSGEIRDKIRLDNSHRWMLYGATLLVWVSGGLWLLWKRPWNETGDLPLDSSWPPLLMKIHGAAAMAVLVLLGSMLAHVRRGLAVKRNRTSGLFLLSVFLFLAVTGWMLYYLGDERWRNIASFSHWTVGLGLAILLPGHILLGRKVLGKMMRRAGLLGPG
jgi:hypothetical protein